MVDRILWAGVSKPHNYTLRGPINLFPYVEQEPLSSVTEGSVEFSSFATALFFVEQEGDPTVEDVPCRVPCLTMPRLGTQKTEKCILYCKANSEDLWQGHSFLNALRERLGVHVFVFEYPGYNPGLYPGTPTPKSVRSSMAALYRFLLQVAGLSIQCVSVSPCVRPSIRSMQQRPNFDAAEANPNSPLQVACFRRENILVLGRSIGTAVALDFLSTGPEPPEVGGLALLSGFTSVRGIVESSSDFVIGLGAHPVPSETSWCI
jgi:hypothetical protein